MGANDELIPLCTLAHQVHQRLQGERVDVVLGFLYKKQLSDRKAEIGDEAHNVCYAFAHRLERNHLSLDIDAGLHPRFRRDSSHCKAENTLARVAVEIVPREVWIRESRQSRWEVAQVSRDLCRRVPINYLLIASSLTARQEGLNPMHRLP